MSSFTFTPFDITETSLPSVMNGTPSPRPFSALNDAELEAAVGLLPQTICTTLPTETISQYQQLPNQSASFPTATCTTPAPTLPIVEPSPPSSPRPLPPTPDHQPHPSSHSQPSTHGGTPPTNPSSSTISTPPNSTPPLLPPSNCLLSAVDLAKRAAEQITVAELAKKRRNPDGVPIGAKRHKPDLSASDDDHPERVSHRKYQKRLQKNRDSAFVSRIRRREYTRILEKSLSEVEKEKNEAVSRFLDMKRRFELVSAELNGMRQVAQSSFAHLRDSVMANVAITDSNADTNPARPRGAVTMFMFALMFGALMPDIDSRSAGDTSVATRLFGFLRGKAAAGTRDAYVAASGMADAVKGKRGSVWGGSVRIAESMDMPMLPVRQLLLANMRADMQTALGETSLEEAMERIEVALDRLSEAELVVINAALLQGRERDTKAAERVRRVVEQLRETSGTKDAESELDDLSEQLERVDLEGDR